MRSAGCWRHRPSGNLIWVGPMLVRSRKMTVLKRVTAECIEEIPALFCNNCHEPWPATKRGLDINHCKIVSKTNRGEANLIAITSEPRKCLLQQSRHSLDPLVSKFQPSLAPQRFWANFVPAPCKVAEIQKWVCEVENLGEELRLYAIDRPPNVQAHSSLHRCREISVWRLVADCN